MTCSDNDPVPSLAEFDYDLPRSLIAQEPCRDRASARLLVVERNTGRLDPRHRVADLPDLLDPGDLLILNDTRVLPARLLGRRHRTGGKWEGLFLRQIESGLWEILGHTRGRLQVGEQIDLDRGGVTLTLVEKTPGGRWLVQPSSPGSAESVLGRCGHVPLPPYIRRDHGESAQDQERYQTVFAARPGAVAAPTAALHFTEPLLQQLAERGIGQSKLTLHVGIGTFRPIRTERLADHVMHREWCELPPATAEAIRGCRARHGRVVAVGTTCVRVLETVAASGPIRPWSGETDLFIYPPYRFRAVDALLTNFHLPRTSLLVLVSAFAGIELIRAAYQLAIEEKFRFYSYGDAMLIL